MNKTEIVNYLLSNPKTAVEVIEELISKTSEKNMKAVKTLDLTGNYGIDNGFWSITNRWNEIVKLRQKKKCWTNLALLSTSYFALSEFWSINKGE